MLSQNGSLITISPDVFIKRCSFQVHPDASLYMARKLSRRFHLWPEWQLITIQGIPNINLVVMNRRGEREDFQLSGELGTKEKIRVQLPICHRQNQMSSQVERVLSKELIARGY